MKYLNFSSIKEAIAHYLSSLSSNDRQSLARSGIINVSDIAIASLPKEYDKVEYQTVVNGKHVETVGEYKAEVAKMGNDWEQPHVPSEWSLPKDNWQG